MTSELGTSDSILVSTLLVGETQDAINIIELTAYNQVIFTNVADVVLTHNVYLASSFLPLGQEASRQISYALGPLRTLAIAAQTIDVTGDVDGVDRSVLRDLAWRGPTTFPAGGNAQDEVQIISSVVADSGTYTLTFDLEDGTSFTTGDISFDADPQAAINTAGAANVFGWVDNDIKATGGPINDGTISLRFRGASLRRKPHGLTTATSSLLDGATPVSISIARTQTGQPTRLGWSCLYALDVVNDLPGEFGVVPTGGFDVNFPGDDTDYPSQTTIRALAKEMAFEEDNAELYTTLLVNLGLTP